MKDNGNDKCRSHYYIPNPRLKSVMLVEFYTIFITYHYVHFRGFNIWEKVNKQMMIRRNPQAIFHCHFPSFFNEHCKQFLFILFFSSSKILFYKERKLSPIFNSVSNPSLFSHILYIYLNKLFVYFFFNFSKKPPITVFLNIKSNFL